MTEIRIPENIRFVMNKLEEAKFEAYVVGGCVRDSILGRTPKDWDLTTNATPDEIKEVFKDYPIINNNGEKHGTVTVRYNEENIEITTYRIDGEYKDGRHPESVEFTRDIEKDLARRDFTINAIAYDGHVFIDPFGGMEDLDAKIIRAVGDPYERFREDFLRILRGLRFACRYDFDIEENTYTAMDHLRGGLSRISAERIQSELNKIISYGKNLAKRVHCGGYQHVVHHLIATIIPELENMSSYTFDLLDDVHDDEGDFLVMNLTRFFRELSDEQVLSVLKRLRYSNKITKDILTYRAGFHKDFTDKLVLKYFLKDLRSFGYPLVTEDDKLITLLIHMQDCTCAPVTYNYVGYRQKALINLLDIEHNNECYSLDTLAINGDDLILEGITEGFKIKALLNECLDLVIHGTENTKETLLRFVNLKYLHHNC